jgi:hypothetical protein
LSAFARSIATTAALPSANCSGGFDDHAVGEHAVRPETRSVFALAAEKARSAARSSSTTDCGVVVARTTASATAWRSA